MEIDRKTAKDFFRESFAVFFLFLGPHFIILLWYTKLYRRVNGIGRIGSFVIRKIYIMLKEWDGRNEANHL
ncbi:hypothetical protein GCM10020331_053250 [Ectobacillus funiculus]